MATNAEKEQLLETLKFTPRTYTINIQGYGGEAYAGTVDRKVYDFFKQHQIDIEEFASDWDGRFESIPREYQPFSPGNPYDCDNLFHCSGAELSDLNEITVYDENGTEHWSHNCGWSDLEDAGVTVEEFSNVSFEDDLQEGEVAFWGGQGEKGCFFDGEIYLTEPFDPKKLKIIFENCDGWCIINYVEYNGEEIDGAGGYSTTGKWAENKWVLGGDEEVYESVSIDDRDDELPWANTESVSTSDSTIFDWSPQADFECVQCDWKGTVDELKYNENDEMLCPECGESVESIDHESLTIELDNIFNEHMLTEWFDNSVNPVHKGEYECEFKVVTWPWPAVRMCEWTGKKWKDTDGKKVKGEFKWRGIKEEFKDIS